MNTRKKGARYEAEAEAYLKEKGYQILERNYRDRFGEIDLIAKQGDTLIYCEVKFRKNDRWGDPLEAVDAKKQRKISRMALRHLTVRGYGPDTPCRFDVIAIYGDKKTQHIENAFLFQG